MSPDSDHGVAEVGAREDWLSYVPISVTNM
jgi:hypothetical protein